MIEPSGTVRFPILVLMGMKHCGKSSLGKLLAEKRSYPFHDLDDCILESARDYDVSSVRELYRLYGRDTFMRVEAAAARKLVELVSGEGTSVAALGGGTIENGEAMEAFRARGSFVYISVDPEILFARILASGLPPFLSADSPYEDFLKLYETRTALFRDAADITVELSGVPLPEALLRLEDGIEELVHGR